MSGESDSDPFLTVVRFFFGLACAIGMLAIGLLLASYARYAGIGGLSEWIVLSFAVTGLLIGISVFNEEVIL